MKLIGPFEQVITFKDAPLKGPLKNESLAIIENGGVLIDDGVIKAVDQFSRLQTQADETEEIKEPLVLLPGFIDCHTHLIWGGKRAGDFEKRNSGFSYQQILQEGGGILSTVDMTRQASDEELERRLLYRLERHLSDGITTVEVKSGYGLSIEEEIRILRIIKNAAQKSVQDVVSTFLGAHVVPKGQSGKNYLELLIAEAFPLIKGEGLTRRVDAFIEKEAFPAEIAHGYLSAAKKSGFHLAVHAGQFSPGGVHVAVELNAVSADHLETIGDAEIRLLAKSDTVAVALPGASIGLGMAMTPARKLLDEGASVAIATDWNPGSAPQGDLISQAALLCTYEKLSSAETLAGLTFRSANALKIPGRGKIVPGNVADFVAFPTDDYRDILYQMGRLRPSQTWKNGNKTQ